MAHRPRSPILRQIEDDPPLRPACFANDAEWKGWLTSAHLSGLPVARRQQMTIHGIRTTASVLLDAERINYCADCTAEKKAEMQALGLCHPPLRPVMEHPPLAVERRAAPRTQSDDAMTALLNAWSGTYKHRRQTAPQVHSSAGIHAPTSAPCPPTKPINPDESSTGTPSRSTIAQE